ncbi:hypothetical protein V5799_009220 [Amblyomma americanum]|uniref:Uncharacterized protein n=1 Tax=Amblyomma americanum TaxID=6943 RepID=A0AAQ4FAY1_AMBAM
METLHLVDQESSKKDHNRPIQRAARTTTASIGGKDEAYLRYLHLLSAAAEPTTQGVWLQIYLLQVFARLMETLHLVDQESSKKDHNRPLQRAARTTTASIGEKVEAYLCYLHVLSAAPEATTQRVWPQSYLLQVFARLMETLHLVDQESSRKDHDRPIQRAARTTTASIGGKDEAYLRYLHLLSAAAEPTTQGVWLQIYLLQVVASAVAEAITQGVWPQSYLLQVFARLIETLHLVGQESSKKDLDRPLQKAARTTTASIGEKDEAYLRYLYLLSAAAEATTQGVWLQSYLLQVVARIMEILHLVDQKSSKKDHDRPLQRAARTTSASIGEKVEAYLCYLHLLCAAAEATTQGVWLQSCFLQVFARLMEILHLVDQENREKDHDRPLQGAARTTSASIGEKDEAYLRYLHLLSAAAEATTQGVRPQSCFLQVFARLMETLHLVDQESSKKDHDRPIQRAARTTTASIGGKDEAYLRYLHLLSAAAEPTTQGVWLQIYLLQVVARLMEIYT